jgi:hypothetical protein
MDQTVMNIATGVMSVLMPYVTRGAKEFAAAAGEVAYQKAKGLLETLKKRWAGDQEAADAIERFEQKPERYEPVLKDLLTEKLAADKSLAEEIQNRLKDLAPEVAVIQRLKDVDTATGLEVSEMSGGKASVTQDVERGRNIVGSRIKTLGG